MGFNAEFITAVMERAATSPILESGNYDVQLQAVDDVTARVAYRPIIEGMEPLGEEFSLATGPTGMPELKSRSFPVEELALPTLPEVGNSVPLSITVEGPLPFEG